jgi:hypothetical protein
VPPAKTIIGRPAPNLPTSAGIQFLHIGVNAASTPPAVPPVFVWRAPDGAEIVVMYHKGSYGDLMVVPGLDEAICFAHTGDNLGPQSAADVRAAFARVRQLLPDAEVRASTMDAFAASLLTVRQSLPVVTQEIGDTWIHGVGSDPAKVAQCRELLLDFDNRRPPMRQGMHFLLYDNVWSTNFRMWYGEDARFRFVLRFGVQADQTC